MTNNDRPRENKRLFKSSLVENKINEISSYIKDENLSRLFVNCFPNTLDTTVHYRERNGKADTYVITGDIPAMWLRDSSAQVWPYLQFVNEDKKLKKLFQGLIRRQAECIILDPYANAFRLTKGRLKVFEKKWELDSLMYFIRLSYFYWKESGDTSVFDNNWKKAISKILKTTEEQSSADKMDRYTYRTPKECPEILNLGGFGNPLLKSKLIRSAFRPSDDATIFQYLIPSNCFAVVSLRQLAEMYQSFFGERKKATALIKLARDIDKDIKKHGIVREKSGRKIFAYEVDGFGGKTIMDDANAPSLLSLPYFGYLKPKSKIYKNTRNLILSDKNPYYFESNNFSGIGSSHTAYGNIWPMSIIMQALTSTNRKEIIDCLKILNKSHAGKYFMHESFTKSNPKNYTRDWFAWANSQFGELILKIYNTDKGILKRNF
jgi:uncharacterized protein